MAHPNVFRYGVWSGNPDDVLMVRREEAGRDYWDGEPTG